MKKLTLVLLGILCLAASEVKAAQPTFGARADSLYISSHSVFIISSMSVTSIPAVSGYRKVTMQFLPNPLQDGVSVFYRLDGSTNNIAPDRGGSLTGKMVRLSTFTCVGCNALGGLPGMNEVTEETGGPLTVRLASGTIMGGPVLMRITQQRLPQ